jgi:hypothetical protein
MKKLSEPAELLIGALASLEHVITKDDVDDRIQEDDLNLLWAAHEQAMRAWQIINGNTQPHELSDKTREVLASYRADECNTGEEGKQPAKKVH